MSQDHYVYHIVAAKEWELAQQQGIYTPQSIETEGFIHCSKVNQVTGSANLFFKGQANLLLLKIDTTLLEDNLVYENTTGGVELFPHLYGSLNLNAVTNVYKLGNDESGSFVLPPELED